MCFLALGRRGFGGGQFGFVDLWGFSWRLLYGKEESCIPVWSFVNSSDSAWSFALASAIVRVCFERFDG